MLQIQAVGFCLSMIAVQDLQLHILASYFTDEQLDNALSSTCTILRDSLL